jgi:hypothetical protein
MKFVCAKKVGVLFLPPLHLFPPCHSSHSSHEQSTNSSVSDPLYPLVLLPACNALLPHVDDLPVRSFIKCYSSCAPYLNGISITYSLTCFYFFLHSIHSCLIYVLFICSVFSSPSHMCSHNDVIQSGEHLP